MRRAQVGKGGPLTSFPILVYLSNQEIAFRIYLKPDSVLLCSEIRKVSFSLSSPRDVAMGLSLPTHQWEELCPNTHLTKPWDGFRIILTSVKTLSINSYSMDFSFFPWRTVEWESQPALFRGGGVGAFTVFRVQPESASSPNDSRGLEFWELPHGGSCSLE